MCAKNNGEFTVSVINEEVVAAVVPMQEHWLPLSNLDLLLPPVDVGVFFCYKKPILEDSVTDNITFGSMVRSLKKALAQALISYYIFAGEVVPNNMGEPEVLCNNRGVDFVEAVADVDLKCLNFYNPDQTIEGKFVPKKKNGVLAVQATSLKCGGIIVACTFDHRIADAYSANMFLVSWAQMAQPTNPNTTTVITTTTTTATATPTASCIPCFRRSLLSPRYPGSFHPSLHHMYIPISELPPPSAAATTSALVSRIYYVTLEELHHMQSLSPTHTKLECFSAFLWKMVARAALKDKDSENIVAKMGVVVDGRKRLGNGNKEREAMMECYFGNVLSIPFGGKLVEELVEEPLGFLAEAVHEFLDSATVEEHFLGLIDWVEAHRPVPGLARIYCSDATMGPSFVVSSGLRFPEDKVDFGWGKVVFASYHFPWGGEAGYVMPMPSPVGNGDWVVYMHLANKQLEIIESEAAHVFRPLTWDYLNQCNC